MSWRVSMQWSHKLGIPEAPHQVEVIHTRWFEQKSGELHEQVTQIPVAPVPTKVTPVASWGVLCDQLNEEGKFGTILQRQPPSPRDDTRAFPSQKGQHFVFTWKVTVALDIKLPFPLQGLCWKPHLWPLQDALFSVLVFDPSLLATREVVLQKLKCSSWAHILRIHCS